MQRCKTIRQKALSFQSECQALVVSYSWPTKYLTSVLAPLVAHLVIKSKNMIVSDCIFQTMFS